MGISAALMASSDSVHRSLTAIAGVVLVEHVSHEDHRGVFTEVFRDAWGAGPRPVQWNLVRSRRDVLRGFHVHVRHADYLMVVQGSMLLQLRDMRRDAPSFGASERLELHAEHMRAVCIPPGVAHGFYFPNEATHLYSVSHYWNMDDELGCRWDDPELGLTWPTHAPKLSERDALAGSFAVMQQVVDQRLKAQPES